MRASKRFWLVVAPVVGLIAGFAVGLSRPRAELAAGGDVDVPVSAMVVGALPSITPSKRKAGDPMPVAEAAAYSAVSFDDHDKVQKHMEEAHAAQGDGTRRMSELAVARALAARAEYTAGLSDQATTGVE